MMSEKSAIGAEEADEDTRRISADLGAVFLEN